MHVLIISDFGHVNGGAAKVALESALALAKAGTRATFVYAVGPLDERVGQAGIEAVHIEAPHVWSVKNPLAAARGAVWNDAAEAALSELFAARAGADAVIHVHQWTKAFSPAVFAAAERAGAPVLVSAHDYFFACPNGAYYHFSKARPCALKPMSACCVASNCDRVSYAHKAVRLARQRALDAALARLSNLTVVHVSDFARGVGAPLAPPTAAHAVVWNPCEPESDRAADPARGDHALYVGRLTPEKGCLVLAAAAREAGVKAVFLGEGPLEERLRADHPEIEIKPWTTRDGVFEAMAAARVLALPSLWSETFGLTALEAMSIGLPAIVSQRSGAADFVVHGRTGLTVAPGDRAALGEALREVFDNGALVAELGRNARDETRWDALTHVAHAKRLREVYAEALARGRARRSVGAA